MPEKTAYTTDRSLHSARPGEASGTGTAVAGDGEGRALVGGENHVPRPAEDVLEVEGSAAEEPVTGIRGTVATAWLFRAGEPPARVEAAELPAIISADENFAWIDLSEYGERDLREIARLLRLHEVAVDTALASWQRPTLDLFDDHFGVTATVAHIDVEARRVRAGQLDLFVGRNFLLSAHKLPLPFADRVMARARRSPELVQLDSAFMLYIILDELLAYYEGLSEHVEDEIEQMEERALTDTSDAFLSDLLHLKRYIFTLSRLVDQHRNVFAAFRRPDFQFGSGERVELYYRDLEERLGGLLATLLPAKEAINGTFDIYVSHVSHRTNHVMKILTMVSTVVLPMTVILSFFSTSFQGVPLYRPLGFVLMLASMLLVIAIILFAFHRKGWLEIRFPDRRREGPGDAGPDTIFARDGGPGARRDDVHHRAAARG